MAFEKLHRALVALCGGTAGERAEIAPPAGARILLARVEAVLAGGELPDHDRCSDRGVRRSNDHAQTTNAAATRPMPGPSRMNQGSLVRRDDSATVRSTC